MGCNLTLGEQSESLLILPCSADHTIEVILDFDTGKVLHIQKLER